MEEPHDPSRSPNLEEQEVTISKEFMRLVRAIATLRGPNGCPWDREQTHESLKGYAIEETYELVEAIESADAGRIEDELGDVLLQVLLHSRIAEEAGEFSLADVCRRHREKLQRRHPHVFSDVAVSGVDEVWRNWERIKREEKGNESRKSVLDGVPHSLPSLMRATKLSKKAARVGFDWPDSEAVLEKLREEMAELEEAVREGSREHVSDEIGDLLFTIVNLARFRKIDPEESLRHTLDKFISRFGSIEREAESTDREIADMSLDEMDHVWNEAKRQEELPPPL